MKAALLIGLSLVVGIGLGLASTRREFSAEQLPTNQYLQATTTSARPQGAGRSSKSKGAARSISVRWIGMRRESTRLSFAIRAASPLACGKGRRPANAR